MEMFSVGLGNTIIIQLYHVYWDIILEICFVLQRNARL